MDLHDLCLKMLAAERIGSEAAEECERRVYAATLALPARTLDKQGFAAWEAQCREARSIWREKSEAAWEDFEAYRAAMILRV